MRCTGVLTISDHAYKRFRQRVGMTVSPSDVKIALGRYLSGVEMHPSNERDKLLVRRKALKVYLSLDNCIVSIMLQNRPHVVKDTMNDLKSLLRQIQKERELRNES